MIMRTKYSRKSVPTQTVGNIGLYYACYKLSIFGWNVLPTSRNTKGIDIFIISQNGLRKFSIQVKTLSKKNPVPLGSNVKNYIADYFIICVRENPNPKCYILDTKDIFKLAHKAIKDGKISYWLQRAQYENDYYLENWEIIGQGVP